MTEHWTENEAYLDEFLRDELTPDQRARFQAHLKECPKCATRLEAERSLVEGIRTVGRASLKSELRSMLADRASRRTMTVRWLAAAAVIAIILTIWRYPAGQDVPPSFTDVPAADTTTEEAPQAESASSAEGDVVTTDADQRIERPPTSRPTELGAQRRERLSDAAASGAGAAAPAREDRERVSELAELADEAGESESSTWSTAVLYSSEREKKDEIMKAAQAQTLEKQERAQAAEKAVAVSPIARSAVPRMRIEQSAFSDAPLFAQQNVESQSDAYIPIHVLQRNDSTIVTIFPKSQMSPLDVRNSVARSVGDTVEVQIGSQVVRFGADVLRQATRR